MGDHHLATAASGQRRSAIIFPEAEPDIVAMQHLPLSGWWSAASARIFHRATPKILQTGLTVSDTRDHRTNARLTFRKKIVNRKLLEFVQRNISSNVPQESPKLQKAEVS
jgi:hypothetical protein